MSSFYLVIDLETVSDPLLSPPPAADRLQELVARLPPCDVCKAPAEWRVQISFICSRRCDEHRLSPAPAVEHDSDLSREIAAARAEVLDPPFPKQVEHQIVCAGYAWMEDYKITSHGLLGLPPQTEADALRKLSQAVASSEPVLVTFNGRAFDLPVIAARCFRHGIPNPWYWSTKNKWDSPRHRYSLTHHVDVMDLLSNNGAAKNSSQDLWCRAAGLPGKGAGPTATTGRSVAALYAAGRYDEIGAYCLSDVLQLAGLFLRTQLTRGVLGVGEYRERAAALWEVIGGDERTRWVATETDLDRFLMREGGDDGERSTGRGGDDSTARGERATPRAAAGERGGARKRAR